MAMIIFKDYVLSGLLFKEKDKRLILESMLNN